jgi:hypothetical protein
MLSRIARLLLTASAVAPVGISYAWVSATQGAYTVMWAALAVSAIALAACVGIIRYAKNNLEVMNFRVAAVEPADSENLGFMILYTLPLFTDKIASLNWAAWIPIVVMFALVVGSGYGYHFNPLLSVLGWHFYKVTSDDGVTYVLVTRNQIRTASEPLQVGQLTEYILLDLRK